MAWQTDEINPSSTSPATDISKIKNDLSVLKGVLGGTPDAGVPFTPYAWPAARIVGDFSNATIANRVMFQTSTANSVTSVAAVPNGGGFGAYYTVLSTSDTANAVVGTFGAPSGGGSVQFASTKTGTAAYAPMTFYTGGAERLRIDTGGNLGVGCSPVSGTASKLFSNGDITAVGGTRGFNFNSYYSGTNGRWEYAGSGTAAGLYDAGGGAYVFQSTGSTSGTAGTAASMVERFRIDASGNATFTGTVTATNLFGQGQTWQNMTGSRVNGTTYYNTTGKPIQVAITGAAGTSSGGSIIVNGLTVITNSASVGGSTNQQGAAAVIPDGASYSAINFTLGSWFELR